MNTKKKVLIALGTFDGLHRGHKQVLLQDTGEYDKKIALMFSVHPRQVLFGEAPGELITANKKAELLKAWGYTPELVNFEDISGYSPEDFCEKLLSEKYGASALSCGFNYRFGKNARGDVDFLKAYAEKNHIALSVCPHIDYEGEPISSTRIRECIRRGDMPSANKMLGRCFSYDFQVVHGDARGRTLDSPTINQFFPEEFVIPAYGVYASRTLVDGREYASVTNIGIRPTIANSEKRSETNIIGFEGDLYGKNIEVSLVKKIRDEMKFNSLEELKAQIGIDREKTIEILKGESTNDLCK